MGPVQKSQTTSEAAGRSSTVVQARDAQPGSYVTVIGTIVARQRENYYTFRDASGDIRVEIENSVWQNRKVLPGMQVRLLTEVDQGPTGPYLWVKSLQLMD
ncbi:NirD/YgiW/YdeI family stress tolerance protein [Synechococcus sp. CS-1329]|uniref:YgiW/YdeI family stress tolerance OB fold protein n=1 Tax=Synechococcus sp. CS-1329 TaxID=2847975 RepID=UPI0037D9A79F|nr:NirD/YgiW/YdeI family stress tolerance protein [Synechococcus sp. CS-1329]